MVPIIIEREEAVTAKKVEGNLLIFGRRKIGKTFLVQQFLDYDLYLLVKRGGGMFIDGGTIQTIDSYDQFIQMLTMWLEGGKCVVIDEFQRLPEEFLDIIQMLPKDGRIILTGSSFHIMKEVLSPRSPILGLFAELKLSLISPLDIIIGLNEYIDPLRAFELSPYLRDPWTIQHLQTKKFKVMNILPLSKYAIPSLIGEIFLEDDRKLSAIYEGIIRALSLGHWKLSKIAHLLYSRKLLRQPDPHLIRPYFNNMEEMDLVRRIPIFGKNEFMYQIRSPVMELGFMLDEKYNFFQQSISERLLNKVIDNKIPRHIEQFCGELFAQIYDGKFEYFYSKDFDIDFIITRKHRTVACGEVKWSKNISKKDIELFLARTKHISGDKIFFSKQEIDDDRVISLTPATILNWVKDRDQS